MIKLIKQSFVVDFLGACRLFCLLSLIYVSIPFHLLDQDNYNHQVFCQLEIRDTRGIIELAKRGVDLFY